MPVSSLLKLASFPLPFPYLLHSSSSGCSVSFLVCLLLPSLLSSCSFLLFLPACLTFGSSGLPGLVVRAQLCLGAVVRLKSLRSFTKNIIVAVRCFVLPGPSIVCGLWSTALFARSATFLLLATRCALTLLVKVAVLRSMTCRSL